MLGLQCFQEADELFLFFLIKINVRKVMPRHFLAFRFGIILNDFFKGFKSSIVGIGGGMRDISQCRNFVGS